MRIFFFLFLVFCQVGVVAATEGPRAFFGFVTHYERTSSGRGEVLVQQIVPGGPAQRAELAPGDRIIAFNNVGFDFSDEYAYSSEFDHLFHANPATCSTPIRSGGRRPWGSRF